MQHSDPLANLLSGFFTGSQGSSSRPPSLAVAEACMRITVASLKAGNDRQAQLGSMLEGASLVLSATGEDDSVVEASIAATPAHVQALRDDVEEIRPELEASIAHHGWRLGSMQFVAADPRDRPVLGPPKRGELVEELAHAIAEKKAYEVEAFCNHLGLAPHPDPEADPWQSKAVYARGRLAGSDMTGLMGIARRILDEIDSPSLQAVVDRYRPSSPLGAVKNLIFGSTRKPDLVLADALSNDVALMNPEAALMYDEGIPDQGLTWHDLVRALLPNEAAADERAAGRRLYRRLLACLGSEPERLFFQAYGKRYKDGFEQPALLPQVWVHYDPRTRRQRGESTIVTTQRMDFLLLLAGGRRVVCEIDGKTHYTDETGEPSPRRYAQMVQDDRQLQLRGYEVYRFGAAELPDGTAADQLVDAFFARLFAD